MNIFKPGSLVQITIEHGEPVQAIVLQACVSGRALRVTYELSWWNKLDRRCAWFDSGLVDQNIADTTIADTTSVGFYE